MEQIQCAQLTEMPPPECLPTRQYVPTNLCQRAIQWVHTEPSLGHPGINRTMQLEQNAIWWLSLAANMICSQIYLLPKPQKLPAGLLELLPISQCPWSHIAVDFVTDLHYSCGYPAILVAINCHQGLPTIMETVQALFNHVFRNYGLTEDIVSDWGYNSHYRSGAHLAKD